MENSDQTDDGEKEILMIYEHYCEMCTVICIVVSYHLLHFSRLDLDEYKGAWVDLDLRLVCLEPQFGPCTVLCSEHDSRQEV